MERNHIEFNLPGHIKDKLKLSAKYHAKANSYDKILINYFKSNNIYNIIKQDYLDFIVNDNEPKRFIDNLETGKHEKQYPEVTYRGETHVLKEWSKILGIHVNTLIRRYNKQPDNLDYIFSKEPHNQKIEITLNDETHTIQEWSEKLGISKRIIYYRYTQKPNEPEFILSRDNKG